MNFTINIKALDLNTKHKAIKTISVVAVNLKAAHKIKNKLVSHFSFANYFQVLESTVIRD